MKAFILYSENIEELVPMNVPGSYLLGEIEGDIFEVGYIGRSDVCLRSRLMCHARTGQYGFFAFNVCRSTREAFIRECYAYHTYRGLSNQIHPATNGTCFCPICDVINQFSSAIEVDY